MVNNKISVLSSDAVINNDLVLIHIDEYEKQTASGLLLMDPEMCEEAVNKSISGVVVNKAKGSNIKFEAMLNSINIGDNVYVDFRESIPVAYNKEKLVLVHIDKIAGLKE